MSCDGLSDSVFVPVAVASLVALRGSLLAEVGPTSRESLRRGQM